MSLEHPTLADFSPLIDAVLHAEVLGPDRDLSDPDLKAETDAVRGEFSLDPDGTLAWHPGASVTSVNFNDDLVRYLDRHDCAMEPAAMAERDETEYMLAGRIGAIAVSSVLSHADDDDDSGVSFTAKLCATEQAADAQVDSWLERFVFDAVRYEVRHCMQWFGAGRRATVEQKLVSIVHDVAASVTLP